MLIVVSVLVKLISNSFLQGAVYNMLTCKVVLWTSIRLNLVPLV